MLGRNISYLVFSGPSGILVRGPGIGLGIGSGIGSGIGPGLGPGFSKREPP